MREQQASPAPKQPLQPLKENMDATPSSQVLDNEVSVLDVESEFVAEHRKQIEETMKLVRLEMSVLSQVYCY